LFSESQYVRGDTAATGDGPNDKQAACYEKPSITAENVPATRPPGGPRIKGNKWHEDHQEASENEQGGS